MRHHARAAFATAMRPPHGVGAPPCSQSIRVALTTCSVDDEQRRSGNGARAMRLRMIGDLVTHSRAEAEYSSVSQLGLELAGETQQDVALNGMSVSCMGC
jgi:hypothetical protein